MSGGNTQQVSPTYHFEAPLGPRVVDKNKNSWNT